MYIFIGVFRLKQLLTQTTETIAREYEEISLRDFRIMLGFTELLRAYSVEEKREKKNRFSEIL